ncbi:hypothetical protein N7448_008289 [Penicillium atrosanguineum]|uniref:Vacuolar sorting protein Vps3844 C-terminal domain-containing protein n=1 Tax=Penicillium atrosanguineum TaxID=1132637 RepID=A0A9W9QDK2_9EURO|nr:uncharacterized protein N7443_000697 [Penicillium atrosanguineum]KAJ5127510.1 hypothetical protein N7448_008289 [Penicillium atrosanguineum]KAJ5147715.1 hypothetical protein N7526_001067 [Penicillium atrosanguineum]KAJ5313813.1 hypothetical protein N7443_000697 [Penicillium atrosanguineum]KAJ5330984.1 hypothetical protein N7476_000767 [Penicillium atrosanguineum]
MRWVSKLLALAATGALGTNALETSIFTFPSDGEGYKSAVPEQQIVSEDVARLILELRGHSSLASVLGQVETDAVGHLNQFADAQSTLFGGSDSNESPGKSIIFFEGVNQEVGLRLRKKQPHSLIVPHSSSNLADDSLESLVENDSNGKHCIYLKDANGVDSNTAQSVNDCLLVDPVLAHATGLFGPNLLDLIGSVETWVSKDQQTTASRLSLKASSNDDVFVIKSLQSIIQYLAKQSSLRNREITAVLLPDTQGSRNSAQILRRDSRVLSRSSASGAQDALRRSAQDLPLHSNLAPVCHVSNSSCAEATNNCSGHGSCYLKYGSGEEGSTGNCYACRCQQTVVRKSDGTIQKIQWGGPACQKKDISSPFFLIAGVSVLAILMVGSAIGMLFSMGQEELPSVISAGVGGSKAQS